MNPFSAIDRRRWLLVMNFAVAVVMVLALPVNAQSPNESVPFGPLDEVDMDQFIKFARARGFDLQLELERIYSKDELALARLFNFSLRLRKFNRNARAYGQVVSSCYWRCGEV